VSEAYNPLDSYIINKWQQTWDSIRTGSHYTAIEKTVCTNKDNTLFSYHQRANIQWRKLLRYKNQKWSHYYFINYYFCQI